MAEITVSAPLLRRYKDNLNAFVGGLKDWCNQARDHLHLHNQPQSVRQAHFELFARTRFSQVITMRQDHERVRSSFMTVKNPWVFYALACVIVSYLLYTIIRRRKGERPGLVDREPEL